MPCVSGNFDPRIGILLQVGFAPGGGIGKAHEEAVAAGSVEVIDLPFVSALVDTGATKTCISPQLAKNLQLPPRGKITINGATGSQIVNSYSIDLVLSFGGSSISVGNLEVCEFNPGNSQFQALIGRDVLCQGVLTMDFTGRFTFSI